MSRSTIDGMPSMRLRMFAAAGVSVSALRRSKYGRGITWQNASSFIGSSGCWVVARRGSGGPAAGQVLDLHVALDEAVPAQQPGGPLHRGGVERRRERRQ